MINVRAKFEQLLVELLDGNAGAACHEKLSQLLLAHPELHEEYLNCLQLHALLQWRAGQAVHAGDAEQKAVAPHRSQRVRLPRWLAAAAALLFVVVSGIVYFNQSAETASGDEVIDRLVQLNLGLTKTRSQDERKHIYGEQILDIKATLMRGSLAPEDRELAESLLENSHFLVGSNDPMAEAERFSEIADAVVVRMGAATTRKDDKWVVKLAATYQQLTELGVKANLDRAVAAGVLDLEHKNCLERVVLRNEKQTCRLACLGTEFKWNR